MNKDTIELKEILDNHSTHYEKVCTNCGECWFGLHCPHDGYQNPCPKCKTTPKQVEFGDCECRGVTFIDDAIEELLAWHNKKVKEAMVQGAIEERKRENSVNLKRHRQLEQRLSDLKSNKE